LEKGQRLALLAGDAVNAQRPGKLESEDALEPVSARKSTVAVASIELLGEIVVSME